MFQGTLPAISNRAVYKLIYQIVDSDTGDLVDLSDATIQFRMVDQERCREVLKASTDDGKITLPEPTTFRIFIPRSEMTGVCQGQYELGLTVENAGITTQFIIGTQPVLDGIVSP